MLDIFNNDAFSIASLTESINILPFAPRRLAAMGLFTSRFPTVNAVFLERRGDMISLIPSKPRGSGETTKRPKGPRDVVPIVLPHIPYDDTLLAGDIAGVREPNSESGLQTIANATNEILTGLRNDHETTHEFMRIGAIKGIITDGDGTNTLLNLFTAFGITQTTVNFDFAGTPTVKLDAIAVINAIEEALGGAAYDHVHALVGKNFWNLLVTNAEVADAYSLNTDGRFLIQTQGQGTPGRGTSSFMFGDIIWEAYRGKVGDLPFIGDNDAHFFPVGVPDLFVQYHGPAETIQDVNTQGRVVYVQQQPTKWNEGIEFHSESNYIAICKRPKLLIKGTTA